MDLSSPLLASIPVVDIDGTLFVQLGIYLALVIILGPLLFKPWLEAQARRAEAIEGALSRSRDMKAEADALAVDYDARLDAAREQAHEVRAVARKEEEAAQAETLATARDEAGQLLSVERERLAQQTAQARDALGDRVDALAAEITTKLLGRAS